MFKQRPFWLLNGIIGYNFDVHSLKMSRPRLVQINSAVSEVIFKLIYDEIGLNLIAYSAHIINLINFTENFSIY